MTSMPPTRLRYVAQVNPPVLPELRSQPELEVSFFPMEAVGQDGVASVGGTRRLGDVLSGYSSFEEGDVVFAKVTPCFENGKGGLMDELKNGAGFGSTELTVLRARPDVLPRFLWYVTQSASFRQLGVAAMTGAGGLRRVPDDFVRNFAVHLPSPAGQERIANFLDDKTARIDALIAEKERLSGRLAEHRLSLVTSLVTQGLPGCHAQFTEDSFLGRIPSTWRVGHFRHYVSVRSGQVDPEHPDFASLPLIAPNHVEAKTGRLLAMESAHAQGAESGKYLCEPNDVVYSKIRPALRKVVVAPTRCLCSADMYPLIARAPLTNRYLFWYLLSEPFSVFAEQESMRVAMPKLNRETLAGARVPLPPEEEQDEIADALQRITGQVEVLLAHVETHTARLREYRASLISAAVTGQLDIGAPN